MGRNVLHTNFYKINVIKKSILIIIIIVLKLIIVPAYLYSMFVWRM